jgi:hypothetical protein
MSRRILAGSMALILLSACDFLDTLRERLQILGVDFGFERLDVGALAFESDPVEAAIDLANFDATARGKYGVDVRCRIRATNPNTHAAAFDGADVRLRLEDTSRSAPSVPARLPAFRVPAGGDTVLDITFPMRLDNPVFSRSAWTKAVRGGKFKLKSKSKLNLKSKSTLNLNSKFKNKCNCKCKSKSKCKLNCKYKLKSKCKCKCKLNCKFKSKLTGDWGLETED